MRDYSGKMRFYCHLLVVSFVIEAAIAANATASTASTASVPSTDVKGVGDGETKNKRQVNDYLRTPGTSVDRSLNDQGPQAFPLQLSHGIYNQQRVPLYTRRPTSNVAHKPQVTEEDVEQEHQRQQQQAILPSYYNYVPTVDEEEETGHIDSRHLPAEPRTKVDSIYQSTPEQRVISYTPVAPKQSTQNQQLYSEDEYLDLIRNTDLVKNSQSLHSKSPYSYATAAPTAADDNNYDYQTKSPYSTSNYKKYTSRNQPSTASSPVPNLQPQTSQQQFVRQSPQATHYVAQPAATHFVTAGPSQEYSQTYDKDTIRVSLKKYHEPAGKTKYDPSHGQYLQEVSVKPTKKVGNFKPSFQYATTAQVQIAPSNQQPVVQQYHQQQPQQQQQQHQHQQQQQQQPLHYQSVHQISQSDPKSAPQLVSPQNQYSIVVPQPHQAQQQAYFSAESNNPFQSFIPQTDRLVGNSFGPTHSEQTHQTHQTAAPQQTESKSNAPNEFRIQYLHHASPTPTPTPSRLRYTPDSTPGQPLKYELFDPSGNVQKDSPKIKIVAAPQHVHRPQYAEAPQYYKKIKIQAPSHVHYVPVRPQYHQQTAQSPQPQAVTPGQSDILVPIQPSRSTLFVAPSTGQSESDSSASVNAEKLTQQIPAGHQTHTDQRKPPLPITSPKKPISQAEFQALIDAGYKVQAIPVPVPVPVSAEKYKQLQQYQPQQRHVQPVHNVPAHHPAQHTRQATTHYIRYHPKQQESEEGIFTSYLKPLIDYIGGPSQ